MRPSRNGHRHLLQRNGTWHYRRGVPADIRAAVGKREWTISLQTGDERKAAIRARAIAVEHDQLIAKLRALGPAGQVRDQIEKIEQQTRDRISQAERTFFVRPRGEEELPVLDAERRRIEASAAEAIAPLRDAMIRAAEAQLAALTPEQRARIEALGGVTALLRELETERAALAFMQAGLAMDTGPEGGDEDELDAFEAEQAATAKRIERARARARDKQALLAPTGLTSAEHTPGPTQVGGPSVMEVFEAWLQHKRHAPSTARQRRAHIRRFTDIHGNLPIKAVTKAHVREFVSTIARMPDCRGWSAELRAGSVSDLLALGKAEPHRPRVTAETVACHLNCVRALFRWAARHDYIDANPAELIEAPRDNRPHSEQRRGFTPAELRTVLAKAAEVWGAHDDRYWIAMLGAYTGARLAEVSQLTKADVREEGGVWFIDINDRNGKALKNKTSLRRVPLHPKLIEAGFLDHVRRSKGPLVFTRLERTGDLKGSNVSVQFVQLVRKRVGLDDRSLVFHSLRHSFSDACRNSGVPEEVRHRLMGHAGTNPVAEGYGAGHSLPVLAKAVAKIELLQDSSLEAVRTE